jgi:DNA-directed RNA polymerase
MNHQLVNYLQFNGKNLYVLTKDGTTWIAVKPICEALGVNYNRQFQNLKDDQILGQLFAEQQMVAADGKLRKMVCLTEKYVYGWLFGIRSESESLKAYKLECYDLLYEHFHGVMTQRLQVLREKTAAELEVEKWTAELEKSEAYQNLQNAKAKIKGANLRRTQLDFALAASQINLFPEE